MKKTFSKALDKFNSLNNFCKSMIIISIIVVSGIIVSTCMILSRNNVYIKAEERETDVAQSDVSVLETMPTDIEKIAETTETTHITELTEHPVIDDQTTSNSWKRTYKEYLLNICSSDPRASYLNFILRYIDNDDIPELLISSGDFHNSTVTIVTYSNGELNEYDGLGSYGELYFEERSNQFFATYSGMGVFDLTCYYINNGTIVKDFQLSYSDPEVVDLDLEKIFHYNNKLISESDFVRIYNEKIPDWYATIEVYNDAWGVQPLDNNTFTTYTKLTEENVRIILDPLK